MIHVASCQSFTGHLQSDEKVHQRNDLILLVCGLIREKTKSVFFTQQGELQKLYVAVAGFNRGYRQSLEVDAFKKELMTMINNVSADTDFNTSLFQAMSQSSVDVTDHKAMGKENVTEVVGEARAGMAC